MCVLHTWNDPGASSLATPTTARIGRLVTLCVACTLSRAMSRLPCISSGGRVVSVTGKRLDQYTQPHRHYRYGRILGLTTQCEGGVACCEGVEVVRE